jgi:hypothetical protein
MEVPHALSTVLSGALGHPPPPLGPVPARPRVASPGGAC